MMVWTQARAAWERRRKAKQMPTPDSIVNALAAWLNGNERQAMHEGMVVEHATVSDTTIVVTFQPTVEGHLPFRASFQLRAMESQEMIRKRQPQSEQGRDA